MAFNKTTIAVKSFMLAIRFFLLLNVLALMARTIDAVKLYYKLYYFASL